MEKVKTYAIVESQLIEGGLRILHSCKSDRYLALLMYRDRTTHIPTDVKTYHVVDPIPEGDSENSAYQAGLKLLKQIDPEAKFKPSNNGYFDLLDSILSE